MKKKKKEDYEAFSRAWAMIYSSLRNGRGRRKGGRGGRGDGRIFVDPLTDPDNSLLFSDPIFDYY